MVEKKLIRNVIKCNHCGDIIESKHRHDFRECKCGTVFVDGGLDYCRVGFKNSPDDFTDMCEYKEVEVDTFMNEVYKELYC